MPACCDWRASVLTRRVACETAACWRAGLACWLVGLACQRWSRLHIWHAQHLPVLSDCLQTGTNRHRHTHIPHLHPHLHPHASAHIRTRQTLHTTHRHQYRYRYRYSRCCSRHRAIAPSRPRPRPARYLQQAAETGSAGTLQKLLEAGSLASLRAAGADDSVGLWVGEAGGHSGGGVAGFTDASVHPLHMLTRV